MLKSDEKESEKTCFSLYIKGKVGFFALFSSKKLAFCACKDVVKALGGK
jgi:hypothetical protein